jgi:hypothetical protein
VTTVAGISDDVTAVAILSPTDLGTVADDIEDVSALAAIGTDITTVSGISDDVTTVAGISDDVTTVATDIADVTTVADNVDALTMFTDIYQGPKAADPTLRNDGTDLQAGDLYYNTAGAMKFYNGTDWETAYDTGGLVLLAPNNLSDLDDTTTARDNLGLYELGDLT